VGLVLRLRNLQGLRRTLRMGRTVQQPHPRTAVIPEGAGQGDAGQSQNGKRRCGEEGAREQAWRHFEADHDLVPGPCGKRGKAASRSRRRSRESIRPKPSYKGSLCADVLEDVTNLRQETTVICITAGARGWLVSGVPPEPRGMGRNSRGMDQADRHGGHRPGYALGRQVRRPARRPGTGVWRLSPVRRCRSLQRLLGRRQRRPSSTGLCGPRRLGSHPQ
jgi:hypothetical protein